MTLPLDKIDKAILALLQTDSALTAQEIAERVGLSQSPCWRRIHRLQEERFIEKNVALLDRYKLGLAVVVFVNIKLSTHGRNMLDEFEIVINDYIEVVECWTISGTMDYILRVVVEDISAYERFLRTTLLKLPHILEAQSYFTMSEVKNTTALPIPQ